MSHISEPMEVDVASAGDIAAAESAACWRFVDMIAPPSQHNDAARKQIFDIVHRRITRDTFQEDFPTFEKKNINLRGALYDHTATDGEPWETAIRQLLRELFPAEYEEDPYIPNDDIIAFINHLEEQRHQFQEKQMQKAPYFAVIQSSGYGKSKLIKEIQDSNDSYRVVYWTFGRQTTFPSRNVELDTSFFKKKPREELERAFIAAINTSLLETESEPYQHSKTHKVSTNVTDSIPKKPKFNCPKEVIFVIDEASYLLAHSTGEGVSFFRCLRKAMIHYEGFSHRLFFVLMATFSTISELSPGQASDPSTKFYLSDPSDSRKPLAPFLLAATFGLHNTQSSILNKPVEVCHQTESLYSMGRPLWHALLNEGGVKPSDLLEFALTKLLLSPGTSLPSPNELSKVQLLALLAPRLCLAISPESRYASSLVAGHMARAEEISEDRNTIVASYPSEPILALASRKYKEDNRGLDLVPRLLTAMTDFLVNGAVMKGHRGEVIVRFLNLWAIDKAMKMEMDNRNEPLNGSVCEVPLRDFLRQFSRTNAEVIPEQLFEEHDGHETDEAGVVLKKLGLWDSFVQKNLPPSVCTAQSSVSKKIMDSTVCFTHFVFLSKDSDGKMGTITHDLLRFAYRRSAAIVVEEGRRGIDWIIPLCMGEDEFIGLVGQDKNRIRDTLDSLTDEGNAETHYKLNIRYFLTAAEIATYPNHLQETPWPSLLFAVGTNESGAAVAKTLVRKRLRHTDASELTMCTTSFPSIVLLGLDFSFLTDAEVENLTEFRDFTRSVPPRVRLNTPITYGERG